MSAFKLYGKTAKKPTPANLTPHGNSHLFERSEYEDRNSAAWDNLCAVCGSHSRSGICRD
jgi:hypothetical protein